MATRVEQTFAPMARMNWILVACCAVHVVSCSRDRAQETISHSASVDVGPAPSLAWVSRIEPQLTQPQEESVQDDSFARVSFLSSSTPQGCTGEQCKLDTSYVRLRQQGDRLRFLPHCGVLQSWRGLSPIMNREWHVDEGRAAGAGTIKLRDGRGDELEVRIGARVANGRATSRVIEEWRYSRAVATAFAASAGFDVPMFGREECPKGSNVAVCEAAMATEGDPLAALRSLPACNDTRLPTQDCTRLAVLNPVLVGTFGNYCGRVHLAQFPATDALLARSTELQERGVDVTKVLLGAAWTVGRHHTPQVESERLAATIVGLVLRSRWLIACAP